MRLLDTCELIVDCEHKTAPTQAEGYPSIRTPNIGRGRFLLDGVNRVSEATYRAWTARAIPSPGDLIMAREAPVGNVAMVPPGLVPCLGQRTLLIRPDHRRISAAYLTYLLLSPQVQGSIHAKTNGATVAHLNMKDVRELELPPLPPLNEQRRIAAILSAYDDLIENCERRIRLLDEMARALYREWFVLFRYPGHEKTPLVDSRNGRIPKAWEYKPLSSLTSKIGSGATPRGGKEAYQRDGISLIRSLNVYDDHFDLNNLAFISDEQARQLDNVAVERFDVLLNITGASVARCAMVPANVLPARVNQHVAILRADRVHMDPHLLLDSINSEQNKAKLLALAQGGATREALTRETISRFEILVPSPQLVHRYGQIAASSYAERENLRSQVDNLRKTRDLLLPRLLSGQLSLKDAA